MKNVKIHVFLKKRLWSTFERKTAFSVIYKPNSAGNCPFFRRFHMYISGGMGGI
jgi:hypothetical protein